MTITSAPWYVNNKTLHKDLRAKYVRELVQQVATSHKQNLINHPNELVTFLINNEGEIRRLK